MDDTLRCVPRNGGPTDGLCPDNGQECMWHDGCKIFKFAEEHDPCHYSLELENKDPPNLDLFQFRQLDSPSVPLVRQYYVYTDDWFAEIPDASRELQ